MDTLIQFGSEIKAIEETNDGWKFGGWLVVFGTHDASNLKDKFTAQTDFDIEDGERRGLYFNHGLDGTIKRTKLGDARVFIKDAGVWIEGQIRKRNDYLKTHAEQIAANIKKFGLSSGAPAHLVERKSVEGGHEITLWPLAEASITPTPAEPLTGCYSLKSLLEDEEMKAKARVGDWRRINEANVQIGGPIHQKIEGKKPDESSSDSGKDDKDKKKPDADDDKDKKDGKDKDGKDDKDKRNKKDGKGDKPSKKLPKSQADIAKRIRTGSAELMELQRSMRQGYRAGQDTADRYTGKSLDEELVEVSDEDYAVYEAVIAGEDDTKSLEITNEELRAGLSFEDHSDQVLAAVGVFAKRVEDLAETRCVKSERRWSAEKFRELTELAGSLKSAGEKVDELAQAHAPRSEVDVTEEATKALAQIELTRARLNGVNL